MLVAKSVLSLEELLKATKLHMYHKFPQMKFLPFFGVIFLMMSFSIDRFFQIICLILGAIFLAAPLLQNFICKRQYKKLPNFNKQIEWTFNEKGLLNSSEGFEGRQDWSNMYEAIIMKDGFLIYPQALLFYWIPKNAFKESEEFEQVVNFVEKGVKKNKRV